MLEEVELHTRIRAETSYGRTQLPRDLLTRVLEMTVGTRYQGESLEDQRAKGRGQERLEFIGGMLKEKDPKGKGERPDKRVLPGGRRPNPRLEGGEGIEPYEMFSHILAEY